ncbi:hypothetical protein UFOVP606_19 [uncultured Caudovirales phage]|uniref:Uncharacterized protein n=1 Tax=uncultured Caudovirales phage TaxID=2100421 RepID=A0A6J5N1S0_9CAUD|nr:hypothetical protein UFOVP606_19 [uncultured Caudovirales phage]
MDIKLGLTAEATGTADIITATYSPSPISLYDRLVLFLKTTTSNTITTPTFNPNELGDKTIVKKNGEALLVGDITGVIILMFDAANDVWILLNPQSSTSISTLQSVTDEGNTTTNNIDFQTGVGINFYNNSKLKEGTIDAGYGGSKGIAQICAVGYELKWEAGRLYVMNGNGDTIRHSLFNFTITPSATDDYTKGYYVGSLWSLDSGVTYICTDSTSGAAIWELQTINIYTLQQVTDEGAITTNTITVGDIANDFSQMLPTAIGTENFSAETYAYLDSIGLLGLKSGSVESNLKNTNATNVGIILEFPDKATGSYTIATTEDLPAAQVSSDWSASTGIAQILNKPSIPAAQIQSDWNQTNNALLDYIKNKPTLATGDMTKAVYDTDNSGIVDKAEAIIIIGRNSTGSTLYKGTIIYILGSTGNRPNFVKARADVESTSAGTFGVIVNDINNNSDGECCVVGFLDTLDSRTTAPHPFTSDTLADGDTLYLSPTTAGYVTNVKPSAPNHLVYLGKITRTSPTNATIIYRIQNGYELEELHNVAINGSLANKDILAYESATSLWKNKTANALGIAELANSTFTGVVRVDDGTGSMIFRQATATAADPCIFMFNNQVTAPTATNYILKVSSLASGNTMLNGNAIALQTGGASRLTITNGYINISNSNSASGALTSLQFNPSSNTNQTASTEQKSFEIATCLSQHATGTLATQRFAVINAPSYSFVGASTITNAATLAITNAPTAATNATITNAYSIWAQAGDVRFDGTNTIVKHIKGSTSAPTGVVGTGAGTTPSAVTFSTNANDIAGQVLVTTGTLPTAAATILTVTFNTAYGTAPIVMLSPANAATALLSGITMVYTTSTTTTFIITAGSTGLVAATAYVWNYHVIQ